ncbi:hypothetical protein [Burkholderia sp. TSV86]|uniref:hypothetical protein n=1 Tax=Burkholderia sp. TSV86 TaxID=1385594 RepID=UPI00075F0EA3|nr:hypothetical protein [Burkholderia sp. TSV86]KVE38473.1 hypothetical protein WS68_23440 [Burkholderia sp. TSV86]
MPARKMRPFDPQCGPQFDHHVQMQGISKIHRLWAAIFVIAVASDVLSGAIRYYTSLVGLAPLGYLPKALMVAALGFALVERPKASHVLIITYLGAQMCVSLANGIPLSAALFWIWTVSPMLFALVMPPQALEVLESPRMLAVLVGLTLLAVGGVFLNYFVHLPWVGGSVDIGGGVSVTIAKATYVGTASRLPGFGRSSASTGLLIGLLVTWIFPRLRSRAAVTTILALSALAIWKTTNKTTLVALVIVVGLHLMLRTRSLRTASITLSALVVALPIAGWLITLASIQDISSSGSLSSMQDRFFNTWPMLIEGMVREHLIWLGVGPGGFGSSVGFGSAVGNGATGFGFNTGYADNMALYTLANVGVIGNAFLIAAFVHFVLSRESNSRPIWLMLCFLLASGLTTDIYETTGCLLFFGVVLNSISQRVPLPRISSARIAFERLQRNVRGTASGLH